MPGMCRWCLHHDPENWTEVLGLIYAGLQRNSSKDCNGDLRRSLVASWASLFPSGCNAGCTSLRRAWRSADLAPATQALLAALGLSLPPPRGMPGAQPATIDLCNAYGAGPLFAGDADYLDRDPIHVNGATNEQVCGKDGHLGLVTAITVPSNLTQAEAYPAQLCGVGQFGFLQPAVFLPPPCPNGWPPLFGKCFFRFRDSRIVRSTPAAGSSLSLELRNQRCLRTGRTGIQRRAPDAPRALSPRFARTTDHRRVLSDAHHAVRHRRHLHAPRLDEQIKCLASAGQCVIGLGG